MASPIEQFIIKPIIPIELGGLDLSFTNSSLWMALGAVVSVLFLSMATRKKTIVPDRLQVSAEILYEFIANMIKENTGSRGRQYFPFIFTLFIVVLMGNVLGLIPYSFTYTSHIIVTGALAFAVFLAVTIFGFINHGMHFLTLFAPKGVPLPVLFLLVPIEIISFIMRPVTLSVRLFANMLAGHVMLKVIAGFCTALIGAGVFGAVFTALPVAFNTALYALELLIALLHAYIFALLACIYLKDTVDLHH